MSSLKKHPGTSKPAKVYWRSLAELAQDPEFNSQLEREFPGSLPAADEDASAPASLSRRRFMQLMGASVALASGSACRWEKENILPFTRRPGSHVPGETQHYATAMELGGVAQPLLATSYDGRPIKVDGNPDHPLSKGGSTTFAQASVLELYDPDRSTGIVRFGAEATMGEMQHSWAEFTAALEPILAKEKASAGQGLRVLCEATSSPTVTRLAQRLRERFPQSQWVEYEAVSRQNEVSGCATAFGTTLRPHYAFDQARVVLALDSDFLTEHPASTRYARDFAQSRRPGSDMSRLYAVESRHSTTGAMADHRLALPSHRLAAFLHHLIGKLQNAGRQLPRDILVAGADAAREPLSQQAEAFAAAAAHDLAAAPGRTVIIAGAGQPAAIHALVQQLNVLLQNVGRTVFYLPEATRASASLHTLCDDMAHGKVSTLLILGGNPVYNTPHSFGFAAALRKVATSVHVSLYRDETSRACTWHLPRAHYLESWADSRTFDGTVTLTQPLIKPLYGGKTFAEVLSIWLGEPTTDGLSLCKQTLLHAAGSDDKTWHDAVQRGFFVETAWQPVMPSRQVLAPLAANGGVSGGNGQLELTLWPDSHTYDGRFANNGWLQELPDFMTKVTWDSVALFAPATAAALGIKHESLVKIKTGQAEITTAAYIMPGQSPESIAITLGYGRLEAGHVGGTRLGKVATVGFDAYPLLPSDGTNMVAHVTVTPQSTFYELGITQDHHSIDELAKKETQNRAGEIIREATLTEYLEEPHFAKEVVEHPPLESLWQEFSYDVGHRWGMAIDLNSCVGCNACVVACQAENNTPIVGKEQVIRGREMHWIRIDRYFSGEAAAPEVSMQPMLCQQCENAPCEQVCPVAATVHSSEGLNDMVYNRCIGTRYCSNNCPYKVRRFNFFNYHKNFENPDQQVGKMVYNPEVTVRARGVMEKCTYCVQRIQHAKIKARNAKRAITDGEIVTACVQACPAGAITFGDLNDPASAVAKDQASPRAYAVLEQLNTKPRTQYLARVKNPNPKLS